MANESLETQEKINEYIDGLKMTSDDYNIFMDLYEKCSDRLFVRIMESLADDPDGDEVSPRDFHSVLGEFSGLEDSLRSQHDLNREYMLMKGILGDLIDAKKLNQNEMDSLLRNLIANKRRSDESINPEDIEKMNVISSELSKPSGNALSDVYRMKVMQKIMREYIAGDSSTAHAMLLSVDDYMLPVDERHIQLNDFDRGYMDENKLTEDQMRKLKSLAAFEITQKGE
jgi:hypothetical protein